MRRAFRTASAALVLLAVLPITARAQPRVGGQPRVHGQPRVGGQPRVHGQSPLQHHRFHHRPFGSRLVVVAPFVPFVPFAYGSAPSVVYSAPPVYDAPPPVVYPAPAAYAPPPVFAAPPAPAYAPTPQQDIDPIQREVVFPTGRYVLRGDGINTPYTWVWIPNPPTAPPGAAPTSARQVERALYVWTDANGVTTWTDRLSQVPPELRAIARREF
jgi:hypothetical protein